MPSRSAVLTGAVAALLLATPVAASGAAPVLGAADGVQATLTGAQLAVRFSGPSAGDARIAGRELTALCQPHPLATGLQLVGREGPIAIGTATVDAQGVLAVRLDATAPADDCELRSVGHGVVARAALDPAGAAWIDETARAVALRRLLDRAATAGGYRSAETIAGGAVVALPGPDATAPAGQLGYWTGGASHAVVATTSATGRRLAIEDLGRGMLRSDVIDQSGVLEAVFGPTLDPQPGHARDRDGSPSPYSGRGPVGAATGVRASFAGGTRVTIAFTGRSAAAFRVIAGRRVLVTCYRRPEPRLFGAGAGTLHRTSTVARVPRHGGVLTATLPQRGDACSVSDDDDEVAIAPAGAAGRHWASDARAIAVLATLPDRLAAPGGTAYLPTAAVVAKHPKLVAMGSPGAAVPVGRAGVWTDGARHAVGATTSASGRRFLVADEGDGTIRTNELGELGGLLLLGD